MVTCTGNHLEVIAKSSKTVVLALSVNTAFQKYIVNELHFKPFDAMDTES